MSAAARRQPARPPAPGPTFDEHAESYQQAVDRSIAFTGRDADFFAARKVRLLARMLADHGRDLSRARVLDVGCGTGTAARHLVPAAGSVTGVDVAPAMVDQARRSVPGARFETYAGSRLPFDDGSFDLTVAICVCHHVDRADRPAFAGELARVTAPGGMVAVFEHNPRNPLTRRAVDRCDLDDGVDLLLPVEVADLLDGAGCRALRRDHIFFTPFSGTFADTVDRWCRRLPLGAQHVVLAQRPAPLRT